MSDLQRSFAKAHLAKLPPEPPPAFDEREEEAGVVPELPIESPVSDSSSSASSTGTVVPSPGRNLFERPKGYVLALHVAILALMASSNLPRRHSNDNLADLYPEPPAKTSSHLCHGPTSSPKNSTSSARMATYR